MAKETCPLCGQATMKHKHRFSKALAFMLFNVAKKYPVSTPFNINQDLGFTHNQKCNFPKLKFWGLLVKHYENGVHNGGYWCLTTVVENILRGDKVPVWVMTFDNEVVEYSKETTSLTDAVGYYDMPETWARRAVPMFGGTNG